MCGQEDRKTSQSKGPYRDTPLKEHKIAPLDESSARQIWVGWGSALVCLALASIIGYFLGGIFIPFMLLFMGAIVALRGHKPSWFIRHVDAHIILGTPYRREESWRSWILALAICVSLAFLCSQIYKKVVPAKPDIATTILKGVQDLLKKQPPVVPLSTQTAQPPKANVIEPAQKEPCHLEANQLVNCTETELLEWGKPLIGRLNDAIEKNMSEMKRRHERYLQDHNEIALNSRLEENIELNRYLEMDYKNFVIYRKGLTSKLKGGDPTAHDPLEYWAVPPYGFAIDEQHIGLSDAHSMFSNAEALLRDLQDLTNRLAKQVDMETSATSLTAAHRELTQNQKSEESRHRPASFRQLFEIGWPNLTAYYSVSSLKIFNGKVYDDVNIAWRLNGDFSARSRFLEFFLDDIVLPEDALATCVFIAKNYQQFIDAADSSIDIAGQLPEDSSVTHFKDMVFSGRIFIYYQNPDLSLQQKSALESLYKQSGLSLQFRGEDYALLHRTDHPQLRAKPLVPNNVLLPDPGNSGLMLTFRNLSRKD